VHSLILQPYIENAIWHSLANHTFTKVILDISLSGASNLCYTITEQKSGSKAKLRQAPLPHEALQLLQDTHNWLSTNNAIFQIGNVDLYNQQQIAIAQKTIIILPLI
jgi:LytS/YehU family sensor histidine kinase